MPDASPRPHETTIAVRGYHLDMYGHVNNARYLEFLEEARWAWLEDRLDLAPLLSRGPALFVVRMEIDYRQPAGIGDRLTVTTQLARTGRRSMTISQTIRRGGTDQLVAEALLTLVLVDRQTGQPIPLEGEAAELIASLT